MTQVSVNFESHISFRIIIENRRSLIVFWNAGNYSIVVETYAQESWRCPEERIISYYYDYLGTTAVTVK